MNQVLLDMEAFVEFPILVEALDPALDDPICILGIFFIK